MANTWHGAADSSFPSSFEAKKVEGPRPELAYDIRRLGSRVEFSVVVPSGMKSTLPVEAIVGGERHGLSFLEKLGQLDSIPLERPALVLKGVTHIARAIKTLSSRPGSNRRNPVRTKMRWAEC